MDVVIMVCIFMGGVGLGIILSFSILERYYQALTAITTKLDQFKAEGEGQHWLK